MRVELVQRKERKTRTGVVKAGLDIVKGVGDGDVKVVVGVVMVVLVVVEVDARDVLTHGRELKADRGRVWGG